MYPPFWTKGNFLIFIRENWRPAVELIIRLTDFATDRYQDWWPYEPRVKEVPISTPMGEIRWKGNDQVYAWHRKNMNTADIVSCALMALEKWLDQRLEGKKTITEAVELIYAQGHSLAFAGVRTGEIEANLVTLNEQFRLSYIADLVARKLSGPEKSKLEDADIAFHESEYQRLRAELRAAHDASALPELPSDETRAALNDLLVRVRLKSFRDKTS